MQNPAIVPENYTHKPPWDFDIHADHVILARRQDPIIINKKKKKKRMSKIIVFAVPADHRIKLKECEKKCKYLDRAWELKKNMEHKSDNYTNCDRCFWYCNLRIIISRRMETIQITALLRASSILRRVLETRGDLLLLSFQWKTISLN